MRAAALADGTAARQCVFEVFARRLPDGRRYGVVAGTGRLLESIERFRFGDEELDRLADVVDRAALDWLSNYRFSGDIDGYPEGELYFPGSPVLTVSGTFADAVCWRRSRVNQQHDSAVASARPDGHRRRRPPADREGPRRTPEVAAWPRARA